MLRFAAVTPSLQEVLQIDVVRDARDASGLAEKLQRNSPCMSFHTGLAVGQLLRFLQIPEPWLEIVSAMIAKVWAFRGARGQCGKVRERRYSSQYEDYMNGTFKGYGSIEAESLLSGHVTEHTTRQIHIDEPLEATSTRGERMDDEGRNPQIIPHNENERGVASDREDDELIRRQLHLTLSQWVTDATPPTTDPEQGLKPDLEVQSTPSMAVLSSLGSAMTKSLDTFTEELLDYANGNTQQPQLPDVQNGPSCNIVVLDLSEDDQDATQPTANHILDPQKSLRRCVGPPPCTVSRTSCKTLGPVELAVVPGSTLQMAHKNKIDASSNGKTGHRDTKIVEIIELSD